MSNAEAIKMLGSSQREGGRLEFKDARGGLPRSFWETYSAFANTDGGTIVLGAVEGPGGRPLPSGLGDPAALVQDLWNALSNPQKVSANLLVDSDVRLEELEGEPVVVVSVPRADRASRPVYVNNNPNTGTYRRKGEGDYRCSPDVVRALVRDSAEGVELSNPGVLRLPVSVIEGGGVSDPRNPTMLTMFNLIGRGDKAGSGFDVLRRSARWAGVGAPVLEETYDPDRVRLVLPLATGGLSLATGEIPAKASDNKRKTGEIQALTSVNERQQATTSDKAVELSGHEAIIIDYLRAVGSAATNDVAKQLGLSAPRTRAILAGMAGCGLVVRSGERRSTRYHLPDEV